MNLLFSFQSATHRSHQVYTDGQKTLLTFGGILKLIARVKQHRWDWNSSVFGQHKRNELLINVDRCEDLIGAKAAGFSHPRGRPDCGHCRKERFWSTNHKSFMMGQWGPTCFQTNSKFDFFAHTNTHVEDKRLNTLGSLFFCPSWLFSFETSAQLTCCGWCCSGWNWNKTNLLGNVLHAFSTRTVESIKRKSETLERVTFQAPAGWTTAVAP